MIKSVKVILEFPFHYLNIRFKNGEVKRHLLKSKKFGIQMIVELERKESNSVLFLSQLEEEFDLTRNIISNPYVNNKILDVLNKELHSCDNNKRPFNIYIEFFSSSVTGDTIVPEGIYAPFIYDENMEYKKPDENILEEIGEISMKKNYMKIERSD